MHKIIYILYNDLVLFCIGNAPSQFYQDASSSSMEVPNKNDKQESSRTNPYRTALANVLQLHSLLFQGSQLESPFEPVPYSPHSSSAGPHLTMLATIFP